MDGGRGKLVNCKVRKLLILLMLSALVIVSLAVSVTSGFQTLDTVPPSAPSNLIAAPVSPAQINLSWTASTDNVAVTGYQVYQCVGAGCTPSSSFTFTSTTTLSRTGLSPGVSWSYRVRAIDAAGNL